MKTKLIKKITVVITTTISLCLCGCSMYEDSILTSKGRAALQTRQKQRAWVKHLKEAPQGQQNIIR